MAEQGGNAAAAASAAAQPTPVVNRHHMLYRLCAETDMIVQSFKKHNPLSLYIDIVAHSHQGENVLFLQQRRAEETTIAHLRSEFDRYLDAPSSVVAAAAAAAQEQFLPPELEVFAPQQPAIPLVVNVRNFIVWGLFNVFQLMPYGTLYLPRRYPGVLHVVTRLNESSRVCLIVTLKLFQENTPSHAQIFQTALTAGFSTADDPLDTSTESLFDKGAKANKEFQEEMARANDELVFIPSRIWSDATETQSSMLCRNVTGYVSTFQFVPDAFVPSEVFANDNTETVRALYFTPV
jgi:hypothetical protein